MKMYEFWNIARVFFYIYIFFVIATEAETSCLSLQIASKFSSGTDKEPLRFHDTYICKRQYGRVSPLVLGLTYD